MSQSWEQALVNCQVEVNRAVFEMNRPGLRHGCRRPDMEYIRAHVRSALKDLQECLELIEPAADPARVGRQKVVAIKRAVMQGTESIATASSTMGARRIAKALNYFAHREGG